MPYFQLNGYACIEPASLMGELNALSSGVVPMDASSEEWAGKANAFHHRRGVDPSEGYLLVPHAAYRPDSNSELIIHFDGYSTTTQQGKPLSAGQLAQVKQLYQKSFKVQIDWARKASPASQPNQGYYLVRVTDARISLANELVGKRFNYPTNYTPPQSAATPGTFVYHQDTLKEEQSKTGEISHRPYTWEELFKECFKIPDNEEPLTTIRVVYPDYTPQDLDFRYVTRRDALEMLCQWCNLSIEWTGLNEYKLIQVKSGAQNQGDINSLLQAHAYRTTKNVFEKFNEVPQKLALHFPYLQPKSQHTSIYDVNDDIGFEGGNGEKLDLWLPCVKLEGATPPTNQDPNSLPPKFRATQKDYFDQLPSQEKIFSGLIYRSPGATYNRASDPNLELRPSGYLESVVWYDIGRGPRTQVVSVKVRKWLIRPRPVIQRGLVAAIGKVANDVQENTPTIKVKQLRLINPAGCLPFGVEQLTEDFIFSRNSFGKAYSKDDKILVFGEDYSQLWDTDNSGGVGGDSVVRFELLEDKPVTSFAVKAVLLDEFGVALPTEDDNGDPDNTNIIYVIDGRQRFAGYKAWTDPKYGEQRGFVGAAVKVLDNYEFGNPNSPPGHVIIEMEHVARFVEGKLREELDPENAGAEAKGTVIIDKYWDGRSPKTKKIDSGTTGGTPDYTIDYVDRQKVFGKVAAQTKVKLVFDETINDFKVNQTPSGGGGPVGDPTKYVLWFAKGTEQFPTSFAWCDKEIPAATINGPGKKADWGSAELEKMVQTEEGVEVPANVADITTVKIKNLSGSKIRGSYDEPLILIGPSKLVDKTFPPGTDIDAIPLADRQEEIMLVYNWIDPRGFTNYIKGKAQGLFHRPDQGNFELGGKDCQNTSTT